MKLLGPLRQGFVLPIIIVLHLPEERRSHLAEVFARRLLLPVEEATDKQDIQAGTVYFATPGYHLSVEQDRSLSLSLEDRLHHSRPSIDYLFESAADVYGPKLAAVLLTGANQDGARGLAQVKRCGGLTIVQEPSDAQVTTMPLAALKIQQPDHVLPIHGIGRLLVELEQIAC
ncbi:Chemotaxis response regulator protein-glutamate methylesterase [Pseudomonas fluorescens]|nr:Chemotaxis response regulator protein-glutamate methylesterase [Pseudomonas fluorescens]